jgi:D-aminopeptidase
MQIYARTYSLPAAWTRTPSGQLRAAGLGLAFDGARGAKNAITDVPGVAVGYATILRDDTAKAVRTGVTAILPRPRARLCEPVFAGIFSLNGNGELSGSHYIEEAGKFSLPITITNTHSCGLPRDATIRWAIERLAESFNVDFALPVAAETYDGFLNDINGFHVEARHVFEAIDGATSGPLDEGSVGGGTGMKCFGFKAGSGTASRIIRFGADSFHLGAFVQANFGTRDQLTVRGRQIGPMLREPGLHAAGPDADLSSIIVILATDAPLLPHQLKRLARRATFGVGRTGGMANHGSGDIFLAFSTANDGLVGGPEPAIRAARFIADEALDPFFAAVVQAVEEAILNSLIANQDMTGRDGNFVPALPHDALRAALGLGG